MKYVDKKELKKQRKLEKEAKKPAKAEEDVDMSDVSDVVSMDEIKPQVIVKEDPFPVLHAAHSDLIVRDSSNEEVQTLYKKAMKDATDSNK